MAVRWSRRHRSLGKYNIAKTQHGRVETVSCQIQLPTWACRGVLVESACYRTPLYQYHAHPPSTDECNLENRNVENGREKMRRGRNRKEVQACEGQTYLSESSEQLFRRNFLHVTQNTLLWVLQVAVRVGLFSLSQHDEWVNRNGGSSSGLQRRRSMVER